MKNNKIYPVQKSNAEWQKILNKESYRVLRERGTENPFSGKYNEHSETGTYNCKGCYTPLYSSKNKFDSNCGWPSYDEALPGALEYLQDHSHGMTRTEILCASCGGHQGHVFNDGPTHTGERYCVNTASIQFNPDEK